MTSSVRVVASESDSANLSGVFVFRKTPANTTDIYRFDLS